ncbi:TetR/AcrR family transcriptional regulator [Allonocardiopsis opalescens]|uniref:TetR family transcriptional regulator n=1 Tax=Allonocardiopsis opalescens TaxID=1144618 RepID=A0A2T0Q4A4_9ACTN|nr:TetR/AcrR family transcriptional regulator [Allonocardiopsis opalescens]PRX98599.1 TetR family transcriptional regulator [Allonocardiopsis opalescens]
MGDISGGAAGPAVAPGRPGPQQQRSRLTRLRLMEATVECLVERGWAGTTTTVVADRAGVSRGAQLHHFRTRGELVAAAVEHIGRVRADDLRRRAAGLPGGRPGTGAALDLLAELFTGPAFTAALELWVAARTDAALRELVVPLENRLGRETHLLAVELLGADESRPGVREAVQATLDLVRGLALADQLTDDGARRARILRQWAAMLDTALRGPGTGSPR